MTYESTTALILDRINQQTYIHHHCWDKKEQQFVQEMLKTYCTNLGIVFIQLNVSKAIADATFSDVNPLVGLNIHDILADISYQLGVHLCSQYEAYNPETEAKIRFQEEYIDSPVTALITILTRIVNDENNCLIFISDTHDLKGSDRHNVKHMINWAMDINSFDKKAIKIVTTVIANESN